MFGKPYPCCGEQRLAQSSLLSTMEFVIYAPQGGGYNANRPQCNRQPRAIPVTRDSLKALRDCGVFFRGVASKSLSWSSHSLQDVGHYVVLVIRSKS